MRLQFDTISRVECGHTGFRVCIRPRGTGLCPALGFELGAWLRSRCSLRAVVVDSLDPTAFTTQTLNPPNPSAPRHPDPEPFPLSLSLSLSAQDQVEQVFQAQGDVNNSKRNAPGPLGSSV